MGNPCKWSLYSTNFGCRSTTHRLYMQCIQAAAAFHYDYSTNLTHYTASNLPKMKKHLCVVSFPVLFRYYWLSKPYFVIKSSGAFLVFVVVVTVLFVCIFKSFNLSASAAPLTSVSCALRRRRPARSAWATWLASSTFWWGDSAWPCWWPWLSSVTSPEPRRNEWRWQRMHRMLTQLPRRIHRILQLIRKVTTYMGSKV